MYFLLFLAHKFLRSFLRPLRRKPKKIPALFKFGEGHYERLDKFFKNQSKDSSI